jgi:hypothetical protein
MRIARNIGMVLLGVWLILTGALPFLRIHVGGMSLILSILAILAGLLILMGR